jgi:hypothetical protein
MFDGSDNLEGTNVVYHGHSAQATFEPGEPAGAASNTVWVSWTPPFTGRAHFGTTYHPRYVQLFTGSVVSDLELVPTIRLYSGAHAFLAVEGTVYHFHLCGGAGSDFILEMSLTPLTPAANDRFADATVLEGHAVRSGPLLVTEATMEPREPLHRGAVAQKSLWWQWRPPASGDVLISLVESVVTGAVVAIYQGPDVAALTLIGKGTNEMWAAVKGGETYHFAVSMPEEAAGDVILLGLLQSPLNEQGVAVPGNVLLEPSWEGTAVLHPQHWGVSGGLAGSVNERGGADGKTWPRLLTGTRIWQDFTVVTGRTYTVRFAHRGTSRIRVLWNQQMLSIAEIRPEEGQNWYWTEYTLNAGEPNVRLLFENIDGPVDVDAFSVVDVSAPPVIVKQPSPISTVAGGTAAFVVGVEGTGPLRYQWFFDGDPLVGQTNSALILNAVTTADAGPYMVAITNGFGSAISAPAELAVEAITEATILVQPQGDVVPAGGYFNFSVVALGTPPLTYQWFMGDQPIADATNRNLMFTNVQPAHAGTYQVRVQNAGGIVWSLPSTLSVASNSIGGALIDFRNRFSSGISNEAPVFDIDGQTRLAGAGYLVQLYAGPTLETIRPAGHPIPFRIGFLAGFFVGQVVRLANVAPGETAFVQVRAWEATRGTSYEEARAVGGKFGRSEILELRTMPPQAPPVTLVGLQSFSLQVGLPRFSAGVNYISRTPASEYDCVVAPR